MNETWMCEHGTMNTMQSLCAKCQAEGTARLGAAAMGEIQRLRAQLAEAEQACAGYRATCEDALSGWRYIRMVHGDLPGVGWDRVEGRLTQALQSNPGKAVGDVIAAAREARAALLAQWQWHANKAEILFEQQRQASVEGDDVEDRLLGSLQAKHHEQMNAIMPKLNNLRDTLAALAKLEGRE